MLCTKVVLDPPTPDDPQVPTYQARATTRLHAPASGRGAQWSACIKTMSVCFTRKRNAFFSSAWNCCSINTLSSRHSTSFCRLSCESDRTVAEGLYASGLARKQVTRKLICELKRPSHKPLSFARVPRLPPTLHVSEKNSNMLIR